jgi:long-subunit acyl-CoA synthetase (AMP-forming)
VPDSLQFVAVGGGRVAPAVLQRVRAAGLPVYEGYGLSECASVVSLNTRAQDRAGTSGRVLPHVTVNVQDGELVVCGNSFLGYLNAPQTWGVEKIYTGDLGSVTEDGFVKVSGRSKNLLVSSFGRNISPEWVESELLATGVFEQVIVLGDDRPFCCALIVPAPNSLGDAALQRAIDAVNRTLPDYARVAVWLRLQQPFSVAQGTLTENGRLRRVTICQHYAKEIEELYVSTQQEPIAV